MTTTDRDYADKRWLERDPLPLPVFLMDIGFAILGAGGIAILIVVALAAA